MSTNDELKNEIANGTKPVLGEVLSNIKKEFDWIETAFIEDDEIVIEESYEMGSDEKNDDDCYNEARENGEMIIEKFPMLEISKYYCHRHKYAIVELRLVQNFA